MCKDKYLQTNTGNIILPVICMLYLQACTVGPDYLKPESNTTQDWSADVATAEIQLTDASGDLAEWWVLFEDSLLTELINAAMENNHDIRIAETRILEARAGRKRARAFQLPQLNNSNNYQRRSFSIETSSSEAGLFNANPDLIDRQSDLYEIGFDASYEIDLFGGNRRRNEAARARLDSANEGLREMQATVVAEVGRAYMELRGAQDQLNVLKQNLHLRRDTLEIVERNQSTGLGNILDTERARARVESVNAQLPQVEANIRINSYVLALLTGELPDKWLKQLETPQQIKPLPDIIPAGLPPELLRRRPDIRRLERQLAASTAEVGVAVSQLYPRFFLNGLAALQSETASGLLGNSALGLAPESIHATAYISGRTH